MNQNQVIGTYQVNAKYHSLAKSMSNHITRDVDKHMLIQQLHSLCDRYKVFVCKQFRVWLVLEKTSTPILLIFFDDQDIQSSLQILSPYTKTDALPTITLHHIGGDLLGFTSNKITNTFSGEDLQNMTTLFQNQQQENIWLNKFYQSANYNACILENIIQFFGSQKYSNAEKSILVFSHDQSSEYSSVMKQIQSIAELSILLSNQSTVSNDLSDLNNEEIIISNNQSTEEEKVDFKQETKQQFNTALNSTNQNEDLKWSLEIDQSHQNLIDQASQIQELEVTLKVSREQQITCNQDTRDSIEETKVAQHQIAPQQVAQRQVATQQVAHQQIPPQQVAHQQIAPQQVAPQQIAPLHVAPQQVAPQQAAFPQYQHLFSKSFLFGLDPPIIVQDYTSYPVTDPYDLEDIHEYKSSPDDVDAKFNKQSKQKKKQHERDQSQKENNELQFIQNKLDSYINK
eukprot:403334710